MSWDIWFCKFEDQLWVVRCEAGEVPMNLPKPIHNMRRYFQKLRTGGYEINSVGIVPPDALGLE